MICEMCKCKHDGKYATGRFCNEGCSRRYSSLVSKDKKNRKIKETFRIKYEKRQLDNKNKIINCFHCGLEMKQLKYEKNCSSCKDYINYIPLYKKLNFSNLSPKEAYYKSLSLLLDEYFNNKKSKNMILSEYGINGNTLFRFFKKNGIEMRTLSESNYVALSEGRSTLPSSNNYMCGYHTTWNNKEIYYRSSYELEYAQELDLKKIEYECENFKIKYFDTILNRKRIAIPDFYLPETNTIVEIKSSYTYEHINMCNKVEAYLDLGYNFVLFLDKKKHIDIVQ